MPYKIKHQSDSECLIEYVEDGQYRRRPSVNLTMIVGGAIALIFGIDFAIVLSVIVIMAFWRNLTNPPLRSFSIELNRHKNHIIVKNTSQANLKSTVLPLEHFLGIGFHETQRPKKSKKQPYVTLLFKFDEGVLDSPLAKKSEVFEMAKRVSDGNGGYHWPVPVRDIAHPAPIENARQIIAATDAWLMQSEETFYVEGKHVLEDPIPEPEIIRDFRDME